MLPSYFYGIFKQWLVLLGAVGLTAQAGGQDQAHPYSRASPSELSTSVSTFLYGWYGTPEVDGRWLHWNHSVLPHWTAAVRAQYPEASFLPPDDIHAPFYPARGLYSSSDRLVLREQLQEMARARIDAAVVSWWGRPGISKGDSQGIVNDAFLQAVFDIADGLIADGLPTARVAVHMEPYEGRSAASLYADLAYLHQQYGERPSWHRMRGQRVFYVYDSYHIQAADWAKLLKPAQAAAASAADEVSSIRETALDGFFIGLWLDYGHGEELAAGGFDGAYSYFASDISYGASQHNWRAMQSAAEARGMVFVPCVAPGYDDSRIRPWNAGTRRAREGGVYYNRAWEAALQSGAGHVAITTWNEWGEGTQIEPAVPRSIDVDTLAPKGQALDRLTRSALRLRDTYDDYGSGGPALYLELTADWARRLRAAHVKSAGEDQEASDQREL